MSSPTPSAGPTTERRSSAQQVSIAVLTSDRPTRRQIARALRAGGMNITFLDAAEQTRQVLQQGDHDLLILDCDNGDAGAVEVALGFVGQATSVPVVLLSVRPDKGPMLRLLEGYDVSHLVAKHGAIRVSKSVAGRPAYAMLDERELLVTCEKVLSSNIFGIEKYIGSWGVVLHRKTIRSMQEKTPFLDEFQAYLRDLECPSVVIPEIVTVAEEFIINAIVHAPCNPDGSPKYEHLGPSPELVLAPNEEVEIIYGCDGQRLMVSISDKFGRLNKKTLYDYLKRSFGTGIEPETKPSGAGLGLSLSLRSIHQLIFNVHDRVRTEAIAGWYLRVHSAQEFKQVSKSMNLFWLPAEAVPKSQRRDAVACRVIGRIDENTDFTVAASSKVLDLRDITGVTSRGLMRWIEFVRSVKGRGMVVQAFPESLVFQASTVTGVLGDLKLETVLLPFECPACGFEERREMAPEKVIASPGGTCPECQGLMRYAGLPSEYERFLDTLRGAV